jgi:hypothetical protein
MRQAVEVTIVVRLDADATLSDQQLCEAARDALVCPLADLEALQDSEGPLFFMEARITRLREEAEIMGNA